MGLISLIRFLWALLCIDSYDIMSLEVRYMNQKEIGKFIASIRKEKKMTQEQLGALLGVTNKTVSRWENGIYMPDISVIPELCSQLCIGINELLSGKRLSEPEYQEYAEENLMLSLKEAKIIKKRAKIADCLSSFTIGALIAIFISPEGARKNILLCICILLLLVSLSINYNCRRKIFKN